MIWLRLLMVIFLFGCATYPCCATTLTLSLVPEQSEAANPFEVEVAFSGSKSGCANKTYYLVGLFSSTDGNRLFGFTENNDGVWVNKSEPASQAYMITTSEEGSWSGKLRVKADIEDEGFKGAGSYLLRIDRFTVTGTTKAESSNEVSIQLNYVPFPTPTPTPIPTPTPTPTPVITPPPATPTLKASTLATLKPTPKPSPKSTPLDSELFSDEQWATIAGVLTDTPSGTVAGAMSVIETDRQKATSAPLVPWLILGGSLLLAGGVMPLGWKMVRTPTPDC